MKVPCRTAYIDQENCIARHNQRAMIMQCMIVPAPRPARVKARVSRVSGWFQLRGPEILHLSHVDRSGDDRDC